MWQRGSVDYYYFFFYSGCKCLRNQVLEQVDRLKLNLEEIFFTKRFLFDISGNLMWIFACISFIYHLCHKCFLLRRNIKGH